MAFPLITIYFNALLNSLPFATRKCSCRSPCAVATCCGAFTCTDHPSCQCPWKWLLKTHTEHKFSSHSASQQGAELRKERVNFSNFFFFFSMNPLIPLHATFMGNWDGPNLMTIGSSDIHLRRLDCCTLLCALTEVVRNKNQPWIAAWFARRSHPPISCKKNILIHGFIPIFKCFSFISDHVPSSPHSSPPPLGCCSTTRVDLCWPPPQLSLHSCRGNM